MYIIFEKNLCLEITQIAFSVQISLKMIAELLKNAPLLHKHPLFFRKFSD